MATTILHGAGLGASWFPQVSLTAARDRVDGAINPIHSNSGRAHSIGSRRNPGKVYCATGVHRKAASVPTEQLSGAALDQWTHSVKHVEDVGFTAEEAQKLLCRGYGWSARGYWDDKLVDAVPDPDHVKAVVDFLTSLGLDAEEVQKVVKGFPHVLACSIEERLRVNVEQVDKDWGIRGPSLKNAILRKPLLLGYTMDCKGDCLAECDHCWARF